MNTDQFKTAATASAWDEGTQCPTCHGDGKIPGGRRVIHSFAGNIGADWNLEAVLAAIDAADTVEWGAGFAGHDLRVTKGNRKLYFDVPAPTPDGAA